MKNFHLLTIRTRQGQRIAKGLGLYVILIVLGILFFSYASWLYYMQTPNAYILMTLPFLFCFSIHLSRPDLDFVWLHLRYPYQEIYLEYAVLVFPFSVTALFTSHWYCFLFIYLTLALLPGLRPKKKSRSILKNMSDYIAPIDFEWISGIRKTYFFLIPLYLLALLFSWVKMLPLFLLWIITGILVSFYEEHEDLRTLTANEEDAENILNQKIFRHIRYQFLLFLPVLFINILFQGSYWIIVNILFLLTQVSLLGFAISFKYTLFEPHQTMKINSIITGFLVAGSLIPFFLPVPLMMFILYYYRAKKNLTLYLHDSN